MRIERRHDSTHTHRPSSPAASPLTGGIASGKSAVAELFAKLGVPVLDTDQIARDVVEPGMPALAQLVAEFGPEILDAQGRLDRARMRERVFSDPAQRKQLEAITHPAIREELARRSAAAGGDYQIHVIPLLVESGRADAYDRVLVVDCPEEAQIERLMARDGPSASRPRRSSPRRRAARSARRLPRRRDREYRHARGPAAIRADPAPQLRAAREAQAHRVIRRRTSPLRYRRQMLAFQRPQIPSSCSRSTSSLNKCA